MGEESGAVEQGREGAGDAVGQGWLMLVFSCEGALSAILNAIVYVYHGA